MNEREVIPMIYVADVIFCVCGARWRRRRIERGKNRCFLYTKRSLYNKLYHYMNQTPALTIVVSHCFCMRIQPSSYTKIFQFYLLHAKSHSYCHMLFSLVLPMAICTRANAWEHNHWRERNGIILRN